jgi:hypothetical protein
VEGNYIILENTAKYNSSETDFIDWVSLPFSVIQQCKYMRDDLEDILSRPLLLGAPPLISLAEMYGFINIIQKDTLYYDKNIIYYTKSFGHPANNVSFMTRTNFFIENGREYSAKKVGKKIEKLKRRIPFNRAECQGAAWWGE